MYGLRQAGRQRSFRLSGVFLQKTCTEQSKGDPCVFRKVLNGEVTLIVCVHVDDLVVAEKDKEAFDALYTQLLEEFSVNDMGDVSWYLG